MKTAKPKSLGTLDHPVLVLSSFDGGLGQAELTLTSRTHSVRIRANSVYFARRFTDLAREITAKHRNYARHEKDNYLRLKTYTGYVPDDGGE